MGSTKRVAIRQPNPLHPYYPYRKEVDVNLVPGMVHGQSIRLDGVVDSIVDAPPADVVFLLRERPHTKFVRRGNDLVMEVSITLSEAIVGYKRTIQLLDSTTIVIGNPFVTTKVEQQHKVNDNDSGHDDDVNVVQDDNMTSTSQEDDVVEDVTNTSTSSTTTRTTTSILSYDLPPTIVQTGDVHVLKGYGMPKRRSGCGNGGGGGGGRYHDNTNYGDLYVQYKVEMPGVTTTTTTRASATSSKGMNVQNLLPAERVELARLLSKLEGGNNYSDTIIQHVIRRHEDVEDTTIDNDNNTTTKSAIRRRREDDVDDTTEIHHLEISSVADFSRAATNDQQQKQQLDDEDEDNLDELSHRSRGSNVSDFFQRAFGSGGGGGGFRYFSSSSSSGVGGFGHDDGGQEGEEEDHKVECNQM
jgi:DnaJ-class molecular chaperone